MRLKIEYFLKELKIVQEKIDISPKVKVKKVLKHAETKTAREDPEASTGKESQTAVGEK